MTDQERDPEANGPEDATDPEPEDVATGADATGAGADETEINDDAETSDAFEDDEDLPDDEEGADDDDADSARLDDEEAAAAGLATTRAGGGRRRTKGTAPKAAPAPTAADEAVHIQDRVSSWFVIATVGVFVVILAWSLLLGRNGLLTDVLATPKPIATPIETVIPSEAPSVVPSIAPSAAPSVAPESPGASASPTAS